MKISDHIEACLEDVQTYKHLVRQAQQQGNTQELELMQDELEHAEWLLDNAWSDWILWQETHTDPLLDRPKKKEVTG